MIVIYKCPDVYIRYIQYNALCCVCVAGTGKGGSREQGWDDGVNSCTLCG